MATKILLDTHEVLQIELNKGDLRAFNEIVRNWKFKNKENALRFAIAVLSVAEPYTLYRISNDGLHHLLSPDEKLTNNGIRTVSYRIVKIHSKRFDLERLNPNALSENEKHWGYIDQFETFEQAKKALQEIESGLRDEFSIQKPEILLTKTIEV